MQHLVILETVAINSFSSSFSLAFVDLVVDEGEAKDSMLDFYSLLTLLAMPARSIETTTSLKRKKNQLRQIENCRIKKTKSYVNTYDLRGVVAKKKLHSHLVEPTIS
jgi:hypothetical protein